MRAMKTIFVAQRYLPYVLEVIRDEINVAYKIIKIGKNSEVKEITDYDQILELQANITETEKLIKQCKGCIKREKKEIIHHKTYIEHAKKEISELKKKK